MSSRKWDDAFLDRMRQQGDPRADAAIAQVSASGDLPAVQRLLDHLVKNDEPPPEALPGMLREYFDATAGVPPPELPHVEAGEELFAEHGPEIILILGCYSLPSAYAARKGVQVLYRTGYLAKRPNRRLFETAQMVIDVMTPGGLGPSGRGIRSAQKVRLMHAAIRQLLLLDTRAPWDRDDLGVPINQEDLAGTLMTFSHLVLDGLCKLGVSPAAEAQEAYLDAWRAVGRILGIEPALLPDDLAEARTLTDTIHRRQIAPSKEGRLMTTALLDMLEENIPAPPFKGVAGSLMRRFLPSEVADGLGVPRHALDDRLARLFADVTGDLDTALLASRRLSVGLLQWMVTVDRGGKRTPFHVPKTLHDNWGLAPGAHEASFWHNVASWLVS